MYNINIYEHIQDVCLLHYNIYNGIQKKSQLTYEICLPPILKQNMSLRSAWKAI